MRVVHERATAWRREAHLERIAGHDGRRRHSCVATHADHAIEVAVQLQAVPVDLRGLRRSVDDLNARRLTTLQQQKAAWRANGIGRRLARPLLQHEGEPALPVGRCRIRLHEQAKLTSRRLVHAPAVGGADVRRHYETAHPLFHVTVRVMVPIRHQHPPRVRRLVLGFRAQSRVGRDVEAEVAVEQPRSRPIRRPDHRHRAALRHQLGHRHAALRGPEDGVPGHVAARIDAEVESVQVHGVHFHGWIDEAPSDRIRESVLQPLGERPRASIDDEELAVAVALAVGSPAIK